MQVFISWSGERSRHVAQALRDWLRLVIQAVVPWMSAEDISPGARWSDEISATLQNSSFGIICLTAENSDAPWILFEAGAIAKVIKRVSYVCPYLIGLEARDLKAGPLTQFQSVEANKSGTLSLLKAINSALAEVDPDRCLPKENLETVFEQMWSILAERLEDLPASTGPTKKRDQMEILDETLELVRGISREMLFLRRYLRAVNLTGLGSRDLAGLSFPLNALRALGGKTLLESYEPVAAKTDEKSSDSDK